MFSWLLLGLMACVLAAMLAFIGANAWVLESTRDRVFSDAAMCPQADIGIVFGTSSRMRNGSPNPYYNARLDTAAELVRMGRVSHLLLSGDNRTMYYNEPISMWRDLKARHVPADQLTLDYAGLSTIDTLARAQRIFGVKRAVLITQQWHLPRALFIARAEGIDAYGCAAPLEVSGQDKYMNTREWLARALAVYDIYIRHRQPRIMGTAEPIEIRSNDSPL